MCIAGLQIVGKELLIDQMIKPGIIWFGTVCISDLKQNKMTPNTDKCKTPCLVCLLYIPKMRRLLDSRSCEKNKTKISLVNLQSAH